MLLNGTKEIAVDAGGISTASMTQQQSFAVAINISDVANYVRWGNDLIIELSDGKTVRINNFFINGAAFHTLILTGAGRFAVDFSMALTNEGDGIIDNAVQYRDGGSGDSNTMLLTILGGAAVAGGIAALASGGGGGDKDHSQSVIKLPPLNNPEIRGSDDEESEPITNGLINSTTPFFKGEKAAPGGTITIKDKDGKVIGETDVDEDGNWSWGTEEDWGDNKLEEEGEHTIVITGADEDGNIIGESTIEITVDTTAPETGPDLEKVEDKVAGDQIGQEDGKLEDGFETVTNDQQPTFSGTGEPGAIINLYDIDAEGERKLIGSVKVGKDGKWSVRPKERLDDGEHTFRIVETDEARNEHEESIDFHLTIDGTKPRALNLNGIELVDSKGKSVPNSSSNSNKIYDRDLEFKGRIGEVEATQIEILMGGKVVAMVDVNDDGSWAWKIVDFIDKKGVFTFTFQAVDAAGNRGSPSGSFSINYDGDVSGSDKGKDDDEEETPSGNDAEKPDDADDEKGEEETPPDNDAEKPDDADDEKGEEETPSGNDGDKPADADDEKGKEETPPADSGEESGDGDGALPDDGTDNDASAGGDLFSVSYGQGTDGMTGNAIDSMMYPAFADPAAATDFSAPFHALTDGVAVVSGDMSDILAYGAAVSNMETVFDGVPLRFADGNLAEDHFIESEEFTQAVVALEGVVAENADNVPVAQMQNDADVLHIDDLLYHGGEQQAAVAVDMVESLLAGSLLPFSQHDMTDIETAIACQQVIV